MRTSFVLGGLAATASAYVRCLDTPPTETFRLATENLPLRVAPAAAATTIDVFVHVVTTQQSKGAYPQSQINNQISVMNKRYNPYGISWRLSGTTYTVNNAWAISSPYTQAEINMKNALHKGTYADLNLYFLSDLGSDGQGPDGLLGQCFFPYTDGRGNQTAVRRDGCVIQADTMPGGSAAPYNLGITAVHEVGHWFGLYHPFQGSACSGPGDYVNDTPLQSTPSYGCPDGKDSCPGKAGKDVIHNYMDYSDDYCLTKFSPGQSARLHAIYDMYRAD